MFIYCSNCQRPCMYTHKRTGTFSHCCNAPTTFIGHEERKKDKNSDIMIMVTGVLITVTIALSIATIVLLFINS